MDKVRKNIVFPEANINAFAKMAERIGMDTTGMLNLAVGKDELYRATKPDTVARLVTIFKIAQLLNMEIILTPKEQKDETSQI